MAGPPAEVEATAALEAERQFIFSLGGFGLEIPGATLVTHEKIPVPRFNFGQVRGVGPERQASFFERALDHYFQRALRPTFRVPLPVPPHLDRGWRGYGFCPAEATLGLFLARRESPSDGGEGIGVRPAVDPELDLLVSFWTDEKERPEFRTAVDVAWHHPNPEERLVPLVATVEGEAVSAALAYRYRETAGIHLVTTRPEARGLGAASALVSYVATARPLGEMRTLSLFSRSPRLNARLETLGFERSTSFLEYELPRDAELSVPSPGPAGPPRWRPPRPTGIPARDRDP